MPTRRRTATTLTGAALVLVLALGGPASGEPAAASRDGYRHATTTASTAGHRHRLRSFLLHAASFNISGILNDDHGRGHRPWHLRRAKVARQLLGERAVGPRGPTADVIALQEANTSLRLAHGRTQYTDLVHALNHWAPGRQHYRAVRPSLHLNATRIAYDARRVRLLRAGAVRWRAQETKVDGKRMLAWAVFRTRATHKRFFFASVHLETASRKVRLRQWKQLVKVVPHLAHTLPIVVAGDFNSTRNKRHDAARRMLPRMRKAGIGDALGQYGPGYLTVHQLRTDHAAGSVWNSVNGYRRHLRRFEHRGRVGVGVDYVFASNRLRVTDWQLVADHRRGRARLRGVIPSDHNQIRATIVLKSRR